MKKNRPFWIFYFIWCIFNISLLVMAVSDVFGTFNKTPKEFWPFTVGSPRYYDYLELLVYLGIPMIIFLLTQFVKTYYPSKNNK